jgi:hypothetical protein
MRGSVRARHAYCLVSVAEDARFELARRCHQHAFQVCGPVSAEVPHGAHQEDPALAGRWRTVLNAGE